MSCMFKDISRKVKENIKSRMKEGKYLASVPYGYKRSPLDREKIIIDEESARYPAPLIISLTEPTIYLKASIEQLLHPNNGDDPDGNGGGNNATVFFIKQGLLSSLLYPRLP